ncbi:permease [Sulfitobacter donghicola]|uniref:Permease n=1 Tax=Sulfitobacter donghicola DSW-25 = KCTC 12864 = JCM 14565 TaxID=1300350 RepID=A0A073IIJ8_9RHOB|nr:permease [Sulfitobacter donghicola]KEJ90153.1 permease [Sulfitobacter donghicola DSW-25 = KCTC 12864 = JCM 14565]KIN66689.1 Permease [Sulfitobacter donghicola DSW-25 = KCTC 12864 = JCM 14565]
MSDVTHPQHSTLSVLRILWKDHRIWMVSVLILLLLAIFDRPQAIDSANFVLAAVLHTAPYLLLSIGLAAWAGATGADNLIARAFVGAPALMIVLGALAGGLSPFCSCGVIPLIAALLAMGVPLSAVMAFWLASPIMDPSMFFLTTGVLDFEFAIAKTLAALGLGIFGGTFVHLIGRRGVFDNPLREGIGNGGCGGSKITAPKPVVWDFWKDSERRARFGRDAMSTTIFLLKWLTLAFLIESLMLAWIPAETVTSALGGEGIVPIIIATFVGVPAYLNGYAALPLVAGLIDQGMAPGAGMAFLVAGGVTSIPAAMAVWALARPQVFALYIALSLSGAFIAGVLFQIWAL